jgi:hypothetical protein
MKIKTDIDSGVLVSEIEWGDSFRAAELPRQMKMDLAWAHTADEIEYLISNTLDHTFNYRHEGFKWRFATELDG